MITAHPSIADDRVNDLLEFMTRPAAPNTEGELMTLRLHLTELTTLPISISQFHRMLDLFQSRVEGLWASVTRRLSGAGRPLAKEVQALAESLDAIETQLFEGYLRVLQDIEQRLVRNRRRDPTLVAGRALKALRDRLILAAFSSRAAPAGIWSEAHRLFRLACGEKPFDQSQALGERDARRVYREMLAFATAQPDSLSGPEIAAAADYAVNHAQAVVIFGASPAQLDYRLFWFAANSDMAPVALARRAPDPESEIFFFSCERIGALAAEHARAIEGGAPPETLALPESMAQPRLRTLLNRLNESWAEPAARHLVRRRQHYQVQMLIGLSAIARHLETSALEGESVWNVRDESPAGYAVLHDSGPIANLAPGEVVAIRSDADKPWDICVVRRALAQGKGQAQAGLQVLGAGARAVRVAFRQVSAEAKAAHEALWLPALPVVRSHNAIVVPAGIATSPRFVMVTSNGRTHVTQGRTISQDVQTAHFEVLQFEDDPYPL